MANLNLYLPDDLMRRYEAANGAGLIERGFLSQALRQAVSDRLDAIDARADSYARYQKLLTEEPVQTKEEP